MIAPLLVVSGTGTGIGKTRFAVALLSDWAQGKLRVTGLKPVESGVSTAPLTDVARLEQASTFHVKHSFLPYLLADPVSPHLAARREACRIDLGEIAAWVSGARVVADAVVVELPGGLFTPLSETALNVDLLRLLAPTRTILIAPDRLGVLHDVIATTRAASASGVTLDGVVVNAVEPALTRGTNVEELGRVQCLPVLGSCRWDEPPPARRILETLELIKPEEANQPTG